MEIAVIFLKQLKVEDSPKKEEEPEFDFLIEEIKDADHKNIH
jgi:hypothetical protein